MMQLLLGLWLSTSPCPLCDYYLNPQTAIIAELTGDTSLVKETKIDGERLQETRFFLDIVVKDPLFSGLEENQKLHFPYSGNCRYLELAFPEKRLVYLSKQNNKRYELGSISCLWDIEEPQVDSFSYSEYDENSGLVVWKTEISKAEPDWRVCDSTQRINLQNISDFLDWTKRQEGKQSYLFGNEYRVEVHCKNAKLHGDFSIYNRTNQLILKGMFKYGNPVGAWQYYQYQGYAGSNFDFSNHWTYVEYKLPQMIKTKNLPPFIRPIDSTQLVYDSLRADWAHPDFISLQQRQQQ